MAKKSKKKKKQLKRYHFVAAQPTDQAAAIAAPAKAQANDEKTDHNAEQSRPVKSPPVETEAQSKLTVMKQDARSTILIGGSIVAVLILMWVLFEHTGIGASVYRLIKI